MKQEIDVTSFNKNAWNNEVEKGNEWTIPVSPDEIANARLGNFRFCLPQPNLFRRNGSLL